MAVARVDLHVGDGPCVGAFADRVLAEIHNLHRLADPAIERVDEGIDRPVSQPANPLFIALEENPELDDLPPNLIQSPTVVGNLTVIGGVTMVGGFTVARNPAVVRSLTVIGSLTLLGDLFPVARARSRLIGGRFAIGR